ncbi:MAG: IS110 family transposase [Thermomicrobiales bacterium]
MDSDPIVVGIDVAAAQLDVAVEGERRPWQVPNTAAGIARLVAELTPRAVRLVVLEVTGGYEAAVVAALGVAELPVAVINPRQVREFARATGVRAKTDALDARVLARFGAVVNPEPRPLPTADVLALRALATRRRQLVEMIIAEQQRRRGVPSRVLAQIATHVAWLREQVAALDAEVQVLIAASPLWRVQEDLLRGVPGVGPVLTLALLSGLPELGRLDRKAIAALVGVAPLNRDSGTFRGKRTVWGGRATVRATLYLATLVATMHNPLIRAFYHRLLAAGKPQKLALTAAMRKLLTILNAMMRDGTPWNAVHAQTP